MLLMNISSRVLYLFDTTRLGAEIWVSYGACDENALLVSLNLPVPCCKITEHLFELLGILPGNITLLSGILSKIK